MAVLGVTNSFSSGTAIVASQMNTNFDDIEAFVNTTPGVLQLTGGTVTGAVQLNNTLTLGSSGAGHDVILWGDTTGDYFHWDADTNKLVLEGTNGSTALDVTDGNVIINDGSLQVDGTVTVGVDDTGYDVKFFGATTGKYMLWDESADRLDATGDIRAQATGSYPVVIGVGNPSVTPNGNNLAVGTGALAVVTGGDNLAIGYNAMNDTTTSGWNTAIGHGAMALQTTQSGAPSYAQYSTCVGYESLYNMVNGSGGNVGLGFKAGRGITTGVNNVYIGMQCGDTGIGGHTNTCIGYNATRNISTGYYNSALGAYAGSSITEGYNNHCLGYLAGQSITTGDDNVAIGTQAMYTNIAADDNVAVGFQALFYATNITNVAVGSYAGHWITEGHSNTMIGYYAGSGHPTTGDNNTALGNAASPSAAGVDNEITLGNSAITSLRCYSALTDLSDERDKTNIEDFGMGLDFVRRLRPVRFDWDMRDGGKVGIAGSGFIAQELQQAQVDEGKTIPNLVYESNPDKLEAAITTLIPALVQAIQELDEKVEAMA